ncbi:MAG: hypothetical protein LBH17_00075 [Oscillospiraceae bacterium]|nr:hypothetical protein [Oscillospiraceae bacterium]
MVEGNDLPNSTVPHETDETTMGDIGVIAQNLNNKIDLGLSDITDADIARVIFTKYRGGAYTWESAEKEIISDVLNRLKSATGAYAPENIMVGGDTGIAFVLNDGSETGEISIFSETLIACYSERGQLPYILDSPRPLEEWDALIEKCDVLYTPPQGTN